MYQLKNYTNECVFLASRHKPIVPSPGPGVLAAKCFKYLTAAWHSWHRLLITQGAMRHVADTRDTRPARGEFLVMILLGTRVLGMGPLIVLLATMQHFKWQLVMLALKPQSISRLVLVWRARWPVELSSWKLRQAGRIICKRNVCRSMSYSGRGSRHSRGLKIVLQMPRVDGRSASRQTVETVQWQQWNFYISGQDLFLK